MYETDNDVRGLQELLDRTLARANPHLTSIVSPERRLTAREVVNYLQGMKHIALATVNGRGEPRVAPLDGVFVRGRFTASASRCTGMRGSSRPATRGSTTSMASGKGIYGSSPLSWGEAVAFTVIEPTSLWAYASHPEDFPE